jgi:iron complex outermembrane receptor protein
VTELYKTKLVCTLNNAELRATIAYEQRSRDEDDKRNYLTDSDGALYWQTGNRNFEQRHQQRDSLLVGIGISGEIVNDWVYDMYATDFEIREDEEIRTGLNPSDPTFGSRDGRLTRYDNTGWNTFNVKIGTQSWLNDDSMRLSFGAAADQYTLGINPFNINAITGEILNDRAQSRGKTQTRSLFAQYGWAINPHWELSLGLRWEDWQTSKGFYNDTVAEDRSDSGVSPKLSLAWMPNQQWKVRYSAAKALRFPIAEELYRNEQATTSIVVSDPTLAPEEGVFHNLTFETLTSDGLMRFNLFHDTVEDAIYYQRGTINDGGTQVSVNTFLAIDQVQTQGVEWILNQNNLFDSNLSMKFNLAYTDATIEANQANPAIEGNKMPRIPEWRANMLLSYALSKDINLNLSARYSSKSFGQLDNSDTTRNVYGAIDNFLFVNLTANWQITEQVRLSAGIDNLFDELAYVAHPYPMRTLFLQARYVFDGE